MSDVFAQLRGLAAFHGVSDDALHWLISNAELRDFAAGDYTFKVGEAIDFMSIVLAGKISLRFEQGGQMREYAVSESGTITGALPFSRLQTASGTGVVLEEARLLQLHKKYFVELTCAHYDLTQSLVSVMLDRTREFTAHAQQNEKLISLGKLSAGLAHELNNPAAAIVRSASQLKKHLGEVPESFKRVMLSKIEPAEVDAIDELLFTKLGQSEPGKARPKPLSLMERTMLQDDLRDWLLAHDAACDEDNATDERTEIFAHFAITPADLDFVATKISVKSLPTVLEWFESVLNTEQYVAEIQEASGRIKKLVESVKGYTHLDSAAVREPTDVLSGLRSTLTMLGYKLKQKKIRVEEHFQADLPQVMAFGGELNQVWTNLIDNALDAMPEGGTLQLTGKREGDTAVVCIIDNGDGVPAEMLSKIFDPFFTTKPPGQGTGLGLDIVKKIIARHGAEIRVRSESGYTAFELRFPLPAAATAAENNR
ncbi:MAG: cyclic nucleotide-binding domain-containing protein [Rhizobacter sp.]|nr:cyclic nucleotide-binding domain-containing protein [Chlorobiales bacterium]